MRGIEQSEKLFREHGLPLFEKNFPEVFPRLAFGLAGHGSECFGFDDEVSRDHDFTCGFAVWVSREDEEKYGFKLMRAYSSLLKDHTPGSSGKSSMLGEMEHGICRIDHFFLRHIGVPGVPRNWQQWLYTPDHAFAEALNGKVFLDNAGTFSALRNALRTQMPEDVRLKKIAARLASAAQSGQYNFARCCAHNEPGAAALALSDFVRDCIVLLFLLNREFAPYYKWMFRALQRLPILGELAMPLEFLLTDHGTPEEKQNFIEDICSKIVLELEAQALSSLKSNYLEPHAFEIMKKIKDPQIRALHVMQ